MGVWIGTNLTQLPTNWMLVGGNLVSNTPFLQQARMLWYSLGSFATFLHHEPMTMNATFEIPIAPGEGKGEGKIYSIKIWLVHHFQEHKFNLQPLSANRE